MIFPAEKLNCLAHAVRMNPPAAGVKTSVKRGRDKQNCQAQAARRRMIFPVEKLQVLIEGAVQHVPAYIERRFCYSLPLVGDIRTKYMGFDAQKASNEKDTDVHVRIRLHICVKFL